MARHIPNEQGCSELDAIKKAKEDQELWDKVAIGWITGAAADPATAWFDRMRDDLITCSCDVADAFMAEREKRLKGVR